MGTVCGFRDDDAFCCIKHDYDFCCIVGTIFETETASTSPLPDGVLAANRGDLICLLL